MKIFVKLWFMVGTVILFCVAQVSVSSSGTNPAAEVDGVVGLRPVAAQSCVAIWVPIPEGKALAGFMWYNNDGNTMFPAILLESGNPNSPVTLTEAQLVVESVQGLSSDWSEVSFDTPVACLSEGLYLLFRFPEADEHSAEGAGGGAAIGYRSDGTGYPGWMSADGEEWIAFKGNFGFALQPNFVDEGDATVVMNGAHRSPDLGAPVALVSLLLPAAPNPFNPSTRLRFSLAESGRVELFVYSLRGELIRQLVSGNYNAGPHEVTWHGRDDDGRGVASGVYFARMQTGKVVMTQRLVLVQ